MKTIKKILSRFWNMFHKKQTKTIPIVSSTFMNTLYGTVVPAKPAPCFFMVCRRPGEGKTVSIVQLRSHQHDAQRHDDVAEHDSQTVQLARVRKYADD